MGDNDSNANQEQGGRNAGLPLVMHILLDDVAENNQEHIISWMANGTAFKIHDKEAFIQEIMGKYFDTKSFKSFQRSVNLWNFRTVRRGPHKGYTSHELFRRGDRELCKGMKRVRIKGTGKKRNPVSPSSARTTSSSALSAAPSGGAQKPASIAKPPPTAQASAARLSALASNPLAVSLLARSHGAAFPSLTAGLGLGTRSPPALPSALAAAANVQQQALQSQLIAQLVSSFQQNASTPRANITGAPATGLPAALAGLEQAQVQQKKSAEQDLLNTVVTLVSTLLKGQGVQGAATEPKESVLQKALLELGTNPGAVSGAAGGSTSTSVGVLDAIQALLAQQQQQQRAAQVPSFLQTQAGALPNLNLVQLLASQGAAVGPSSSSLSLGDLTGLLSSPGVPRTTTTHPAHTVPAAADPASLARLLSPSVHNIIPQLQQNATVLGGQKPDATMAAALQQILSAAGGMDPALLSAAAGGKPNGRSL